MQNIQQVCNILIKSYIISSTEIIAIFAPSACVLHEALIILQEEANLVVMQISWPKTKLMAITPKPTNHLPLKICNTEVLFVDSFTYLGSLITNDGSSSRDITSRIAKAASAMYRLSNPLFHKHRISIRTKINMYRALVVSVLIYGSEAWSTTIADRRRLDVFDMHQLPKRLLRVFWQQHKPHHLSYDNATYAGSDLHRMPSSLPVQRVQTFMAGKDQEVVQKLDGLIRSFCWPRRHQCCQDGL